MESVISLTDVRKSYGAVHAVGGITLDVKKGEILGLLGHNGAGKTTLMKLILGLVAPSSGAVRVLDDGLDGFQDVARPGRIGYLPESVAFYEALTGREVLDYFARLKGVDARERDALLGRMNLEAAADRRVKTYSKGMRQRLGLAQALIGNPRILLLDEPTVGLDPIAVRDFYALLGALRQQGVTVVLSSHVLSGIEHQVDRVVILGHGRILASGSIEELRQRSELPLLIRVRGLGNSDDWQARLAPYGALVCGVKEALMEITVRPENKLALMRALLDSKGVEDIELAPPTLETLYAFFDGATARTGGA